MTTVVKSVRVRNGAIGKNELPCVACEEGLCKSGVCERLANFIKDKGDVSIEWETHSRLKVVLPFLVRVGLLFLIGYVCHSVVTVMNAVVDGQATNCTCSAQH